MNCGIFTENAINNHVSIPVMLTRSLIHLSALSISESIISSVCISLVLMCCEMHAVNV